MPDAALLVPNWNGGQRLARLLCSARRQTCSFAEILVVDNGSSDGSPEEAERRGARVLRLEANLGFARAVNAGLKHVSAPWLAIVNNDVELAADWLERLFEACRQSDVWFATGRLYSAERDGRLDGTFDTLCRGACAWRAGAGRPDSPVFAQQRRIRLASFTATLLRTDLFNKVGELDEEFESYIEDLDFFLRCARLGFEGMYVPAAVAWHEGSGTLGRWHPEVVRRIARNQLWIVAKHYPKGWVWRLGWPILVAQSLWGLVALRHGAGRAYFKGKLEGLARYREIRKRHTPPSSNFARLLYASELELLDLQRRLGFDWYWKLYFALT